MSTLERMLKERDRLLNEAKEIDKAIALMNKFKDTSEKPTKKIQIKNNHTTKGGAAATLQCAKDALIKYGRPVTKQEILDLLPNKGYTTRDINLNNFSSYLHPHICGEGRGKKNCTYWYSDRPRPEPLAFVKDLHEAYKKVNAE